MLFPCCVAYLLCSTSNCVFTSEFRTRLINSVAVSEQLYIIVFYATPNVLNISALTSGYRRFMNVLTANEAWIFEYDPETKRETPSSACENESYVVQGMVIVFFHTLWQISYPVYQQFYKQVFEKLREIVRKNRPNFERTGKTCARKMRSQLINLWPVKTLTSSKLL